MSTLIRSNLSTSNKYYISKHRYYELKHFCLQYKEWESSYRDYSLRLGTSDPTANTALYLQNLRSKMDAVKLAAEQCDPYIGAYIFEAVTNELTYTYFRTMKQIPCGREMFYDRYRKFFYILSENLAK